MKHLSQLDRAWGSVKMGASNLTIAGWGCTTTCLSMASDYFGNYLSPVELANQDHLYTRDGLVLWNQFVKAMPNVGGYERVYGNNTAKFSSAVNRVNQVVFLEVAFPGTSYGRHWVFATDYLGNGDYMVIDPLGGIARRLKSKYPTILGGCILTAVPEWKPTPEAPKADPTWLKGLLRLNYGVYLAKEANGEIWIVQKDANGNIAREYVSPEDAMDWYRRNATGISNKDLALIPIKK